MPKKARPSNREQNATAPRRWLVVSAWSPELAELRRQLKAQAKTATVIPVSAGVGLVEAAVGTTLAIGREHPDAVLFVGTAGQYRGRLPGLSMGDVVAARQLCLWSAEVAEGRAYLPAPLPAQLKTTTSLCRRSVALGLPLASVACPLGISTRLRPSPAARPDVENLEAFAVGRAAAQHGLPFMAFLGISNLVGPAAHAQWKENAHRAAAAACRAALALILVSRGPFDRAAGRQ